MKFSKFLCCALASAAALVSCNGSKADATESANSSAAPAVSADSSDSSDKKVLVAYFSATGTTKAVAEKIAKDADATLFEIEPSQPYTAADLDWHNDQSRSSVEMKDKSSRPEIKNKVDDMSQYDVIFVGYPIWWYTCPTIINTFLESYDFSGKTIIPFATSGGSPIEPCLKDMEKSAKGATIRDAMLLNNPSDDAIEDWVEKALK